KPHQQGVLPECLRPERFRRADGRGSTRQAPHLVPDGAAELPLKRTGAGLTDMLDLYHGGPGANSLKALLPLKENGVDFRSHLMNLLQVEQHEPWFLKINPNGQVPVLVHDGKVLTESTVINEYVDETFPDNPLRPPDAYGRAQMRVWTKFVDEYFCPAL